MDKPISVGDLAMVVKPTLCCENPAHVGRIFKVHRIDLGPGCCLYCQSTVPSEYAAPNGAWYARVRLKRIPPLEELQTWRQTDETTA